MGCCGPTVINHIVLLLLVTEILIPYSALTLCGLTGSTDCRNILSDHCVYKFNKDNPETEIKIVFSVSFRGGGALGSPPPHDPSPPKILRKIKSF